MDLHRIRSLPARAKALVALAVLLDGRDASTYLERDANNGANLARAANDLAALPTDLRMPLAGTMLRTALEELEGGVRG